MPLGIVVVAVGDLESEIIIMARAGSPFRVNCRGTPGIVATKSKRAATSDSSPGGSPGPVTAPGARIDDIEDETIRSAAAAEPPARFRIEAGGRVFISRLAFDVKVDFTIPKHSVKQERIA